MTRVFAVNENNDIFARNGRLQIATGLDAVLIHCERAIKATFAEMIYAYNRGIDYFSYVFNGSPNILRFEAGARSQLRRIENVVSIESFNAEVRDEESENGSTVTSLYYEVTIRTTFGTGNINGSVSM